MQSLRNIESVVNYPCLGINVNITVAVMTEIMGNALETDGVECLL